MAQRAERRILLATDGSPSAEVALDLLCSVHLRPVDRVDLVSVAQISPFALASGFETLSVADDAAAEIVQAAAARLGRCGIRAETHVAEGPVADGIVRTAAAIDADLIVVGSRGLGWIAGTLLGSVARELTRSSPFPVLVVRERHEAPRRVLVAVDGSPDSRAAVEALAVVPLDPDIEVALLHVISHTGADVSRAQELLNLVAFRLPATVRIRTEVDHGVVADRILTRAGAIGSDLIVLGSRSSRGPLPGSTADRVLTSAHCSVLVARATQRVPVRPLTVPTGASAG